MEWQFRKTLESFDAYKKAHMYKAQIEKGNISLLTKIVSEIQIILSEPQQKAISKVLALRFARDSMVMGREDVVETLQKIVPQLLKICSYELESDDPNRGQTYFHEHAKKGYLRASSEDSRSQIDQLGSTYLILALESVLHWAKWIPVDESNNESIYSKAYTDLLERGVVFPTSFHYYKQSDSEKFKNTYKVEFFTDSYYSSLQSVSNSSSRMTSSRNGRKENYDNLEGSVDSEIFQKTSITTIGQIREYVEKLYEVAKENPSSEPTTDKRLSVINKRLQQIYEEEFNSNTLYKNKPKKQQKNWVDKFLVNYGIYAAKKISFKDFVIKVTTEQITLEENQQEESLSIINSTKNIINGSNVKMYKSPKKELLKASPSPEEVIRKQQYEFKSKTYELKCQLEDKDKEIDRLKRYHQKEKNEIVEDCDRRIDFLKADLSHKPDKDKPLLLQLEFQNEQLKKKVALIQNELMNTHTVREEELQSERDRLQLQVEKFKIQNSKLIKIINERNESDYKNKLENDQSLQKSNQDFLNVETAKNFNSKTKKMEEQIEEKNLLLKKLEKQNIKLEDQVQLYKTELNTERNKKDQKSGSLYQKIEYLDSENKTLKEKLHQAKRTIDVKDVELIDIKEQLRRYQYKMKDIHEKKSQWSEAPSLRSEKGNFGNTLSPSRSPRNGDPYQQIISNKKIKFNNYQDLHLELKPTNKETFLRLCRASFKKKDVLFKQNQLEVGIITEQVSGSGNRLKFLLHLTNVAEKQIQNIKIQPMAVQGSFISTLEYEMQLKYIFCIQPQQQEKLSIVVINKQSPYIKDRAIITIQYEKNGISYSHNVFLPFTIPKFLINTKATKTPSNPRYLTEELILRYTKKMIPKPSYLKSYFENISEIIEDKKYEVEFYHKETDLNMFIVFSFSENETLNIMATMLRERLNEKQKYIMEEALGFMEIAFRK